MRAAPAGVTINIGIEPPIYEVIPMKPFYLFTALALLAATGAASAVAPGVIRLARAGKGAAPAGWEMKVKEGSPVTYFEQDGEMPAFCMKGTRSSFSIQRRVDVDLKRFPVLSWRWKVKELPKGGDFRVGSKDDQAAQLFVAFPGRESINYIWDTSAPVGATGHYNLPLVITVKTVVVASGAADRDRWVTVSRNVYEDYRRLFGKEPPNAEGLRFQINSQHTGSVAEGCLESVEFREN